VILGIDTSTAATAAAVLGEDLQAEARDDPGIGERPRHATRLLKLVEEVLGRAGGWDAIERIAVGVGPGGFTGLRHGISTARALAQARGLPLVGVSSLEALARGAHAPPGTPVYAVIDARRGEVFAAAWRDGELLREPAAIAPGRLAETLLPGALAVGDGAVRFRGELERAGAAVPADSSTSHRVSALQVCRMGAEGGAAGGHPPVPDYRREPDASPRSK
jgi:tRNA threonylcarbamoyladenosine biosynthesis protein TsaB